MTAVWTARRLVGTWVGGVVGLVVLAGAVAVGAYAALAPAPGTEQGFAALGAGLVGAVLGLLVTALGWLVLLVVVARRYAPAGRRLKAVGVSVAAVAVVAVGVYALAAAARLDGGVGAAVVAIQAMLAAGAIAPPFVLHLLGRPRQSPLPGAWVR